MTCQHDTIITWRDEVAKPVMWSCMDCSNKFVPLTQQMIDDEALLQQALEALEIGYDSASVEAAQYHAAMAGYKPQRHAQMDADVQQIAKAISALRERLK